MHPQRRKKKRKKAQIKPVDVQENAASKKRKVTDQNGHSEKWRGWKHALDQELDKAGGKLRWKRLRRRLVSRYCRGNSAAGDDSKALGDKEELELQALASIPDEYLCKRTSFVRLPRAA